MTTIRMWSNTSIDIGRLLFLLAIIHFKLHMCISCRDLYLHLTPKGYFPHNGNKLWHQLSGQQTRINGGGDVLTDSFKPVECDQALP